MSLEKITVQNVNHPDYSGRVDRAKYEAMRSALMQVLPTQAPGVSAKEALAALRPHLDQSLFPDGAKSGWWQKTVQLDLEAKGLVARSDTKPMRIYRTQ